MVGVRGSSPGCVKGFGQVFVGAAKLSAPDFDASETDLAIQAGAGVNVSGAGRVGLRVGVDYIRIMAKDDGDVLEGDDGNGFRVSAGVTFGIGGR